MIRIDRGPEPSELRRARRKHLARAALALADGKAIVFDGYDPPVQDARDHAHTVKKRLYRQQNWKCAFCERQGGDRGQPVEHLRPKGGADRGDPGSAPRGSKVDALHYWWLAWTWHNLLFACTSCNSAGAKGTWFPLKPGSAPLPLLDPQRADHADGCFDVSQESPMLLDPTRDDPLDHIVWTPTNPSAAAEQLLWEPRPRTERGDVTIRALDLRRGLPDQVTEHIRSNLWVAWLRDVVKHRDEPWAIRRWAEMTREKLLARQPFTAASYDAMVWFRDHFKLAASTFPLTRPGAPAPGAPPPGAQIEQDPAKLAALPDRVRLSVRAEHLNAVDALTLLLPLRVWHPSALAEASGLALSTVRSALSALKKSGKAVSTKSGWRVPTP